jgi:hypothetical protein
MPGKRHADKKELSAKEAAENLGMTDVSVGEWGAKPNAPVVMRGGRRYYVWPDFPVWVRNELKRNREKPEAIAEIERQTKQVDLELKQIELDREKGTSHRDGVCLAAFGQTLNRVRALLQTLPGRGAVRTVGLKSLTESQAVWESLVRDIMSEIAYGDDAR